MKKLLMLILCLSGLLLNANATVYYPDAKFYAQDFSITRGDTVLVQVFLDDLDSITAGQCRIHITGPIRIVNDWIAPSDRIPQARKDGLSWICDNSFGDIMVVWYNSKRLPINGNSGVLYTFEITTTEDYYTNSKPMTIKFCDIKFSDEAANKYIVPDSITRISRMPGDIPWDLNGDGAVDVLDLDIVIDGVLRGEGADVNNDGRTDIMDVDQVINAILSSK